MLVMTRKLSDCVPGGEMLFEVRCGAREGAGDARHRFPRSGSSGSTASLNAPLF